MFLEHFKMTDHPFPEAIPAKRILTHDKISEGLARLTYFSNNGTIGLITGQTGVGKSSLIRLFFNSLSRNRFHPIYVHLSRLNSNALLRFLVMALGEAPSRGREKLFMQIIERANKSDLTTLIVLDEAHLLDSDSLIDLRLLASAGIEDVSPVKIILCGQERLRRQISRDCHEDLLQRISVQVRLFPLSKDQTAAYIDYQMKNVGASDKVFKKEAKSLIHDYASGVPRKINNAATACLMNATAKNLQMVDSELVNATMSELHFQ